MLTSCQCQSEAFTPRALNNLWYEDDTALQKLCRRIFLMLLDLVHAQAVEPASWKWWAECRSAECYSKQDKYEAGFFFSSIVWYVVEKKQRSCEYRLSLNATPGFWQEIYLRQKYREFRAGEFILICKSLKEEYPAEPGVWSWVSHLSNTRIIPAS